MLYGALEAGGTKMVLSVLDENGSMLDRISIPTRTPAETMPEMISWLQKYPIVSLGIGCFGPLDLNPASPDYGSITATPKLAWRNYPILREFRSQLGIPVAIDTDVNGAAIAEAASGAAKDLNSCVYVTIGTGIGAGIVIDGKPVHGLMHPELGHMLLAPDPRDPMPDGFCPYHKHCLEGLAAGPAIEKRWGMSAKELPHDHVGWDIEAGYLAQMCVNIIMTVSPEKIILGGGVMQQEFILDSIREKTRELLGGYVAPLDRPLDDYIVTPGLGIHSGVTGAWLLAKCAPLT